MESTSSSSVTIPTRRSYQALTACSSIVLSRCLRDVVGEIVDHALCLAVVDAEVAVLVQRPLVRIGVRGLDLAKDRSVAVHPPEVVAVEVHPQVVHGPDEEHVLLGAVVVEDQ